MWQKVEIDGDLSKATKEWLHTNGAGAYASSTIACMHQRRYHGLLVAALEPPRNRHVMLSHVDVTLAWPHDLSIGAGADGGPWELAKHQFPGIDPEATPFHLARFDQDPLPRWTYAVAGGELEIVLGFVRGENAVVLRYAWRGPHPIVARLRPLLALRHFHELTSEHGGMNQRATMRPGEVRVQPMKQLPPLCFGYEGTFVGSPDWWRRFEYLLERDRGLDFQEDLWTPGVFEVRLESAPAHLVAAIGELPTGRPDTLLAHTRAALLANDPGPERSALHRRLAIAAAAFRADLAPQPGIVAGYPWFEVWGRDTLVAFPGLYLVPRAIEGAIRLLRSVVGSMKDGRVPNRLPDSGGDADFGAADASLWLFEAARLLADELGDGHPFVLDELLPALESAFEAIVAGAHADLAITADGLFAARTEGGALTWMDARVRTKPVTPRAGCPVELTALWAKGCETLARFARAAADDALAARAIEACLRARAGFAERFWCAETDYPYDVVSEVASGPDAFADPSIRPNAIIALAVDPASFTGEQAAAVLDRARQDLVTRAGLRTLARDDPRYVGRYQGDVDARDGAYHQGTVWPYLLGFYVRAVVRSAIEGEHVAPLLERLVASACANELALGFVPEIADGDAPHRPNGCVAQAWSVAELYRAVAWDLGRRRWR